MKLSDFKTAKENIALAMAREFNLYLCPEHKHIIAKHKLSEHKFNKDVSS